MLRQILSAAMSGILKRNSSDANEKNPDDSIRLARIALESGDARDAIVHFERYLECSPYDCAAINDLGYCYGVIGDTDQAAKLFDRAYQLDGAFLPGLSNHAKTLVDQRRSEEALGLIRKVKAQNPDIWSADSVLSGLRQGRGEIESACRHAKDAWMKSFDGLRQANNYIFNSSYRDIDEDVLTAEHVFWAATLPPLLEEFRLQPEWMSKAISQEAPRRIRLGYWSPDLRDHSVFFFAYPLISNHDRDAFEIFIYSDSTVNQEQTEKIRSNADHFHETALLNDADLFRLMRSHQLDILIELAGHTSSNRINLLQGRLARVQLSGLGYPPTTGLSTIDGKLLDVHVCPDPSFGRFYAERPVCLPESFWSFDPYWKPKRQNDLPCDAAGFFTYGCFGNISKITDGMLVAWASVARQVQNSRFLIRSISFRDDAVQGIFRERMINAGIPADRFELLGPAAAQDYLEAYNEVDVVLDTYPFNGGTTSCFALFMGVVIVTQYGQGLRSRMGLSMLKNLGLGHWAAGCIDEYVQLAVRVAQAKVELQEFRRNAEVRFKSTALGDGKRFCQHVETACREMLESSPLRTPVPTVRADVPHLSVRELMRRAYMMSRYGQVEAARRIAHYCLDIQPDYLAAHLLLIDGVQVAEAVSRLESLIGMYPESEDVEAAQLMLTRLLLAGQDRSLLREQLDKLFRMHPQDAHDRIFKSMLMKSISCVIDRVDRPAPDSEAYLVHGWTLIVEAPDRAEFDEFVSDFRTLLSTAAHSIKFEFCCSSRLARDLRAALSRCSTGYVALTQSNVRLASLRTLSESIASLEACDLVSLGGCLKWDRVVWRRSGFSNKITSVISPSELGNCLYEVRKSGQSCVRLVSDLTLLDGAWIAFNSDLVRKVDPDLLDFSTELEGASGLMFEEWSHRLSKRGFRLAACQALGLLIDNQRRVCLDHRGEAFLFLTDLYGFDPLAELEEDHIVMGIPAPDLLAAELSQSVMLDFDC